MILRDFIASGVIETYCLGFASKEESQLVEKMTAQYPEVKQEVEEVRQSLETILKSSEIKPAFAVKTAVMTSIYTQQAELQPVFVPLMANSPEFSKIEVSANANNLQWPTEDFDNIFFQELPSTPEIINFAVWVKTGHEEEMHTDRNEYIAVLDGSCDMIMDNKRTSYRKGDIICIPINVSHHAIITSEKPMFALVQRQLIAN